MHCSFLLCRLPLRNCAAGWPGRGTEDAAAVGRRLSNAAREMEAAKHYDYIVVNQTVEDAVDQLEQIVCAAKHTAKYLREFIDEVEYDAETCCK